MPRTSPVAGERTAAGLLGIVVTQASFLVALMYFLGALYLTAYYHYFRLDSFSLGFGFAEVALQSLNLVSAPVAIVGTLAVLAARHLASRQDADEDADRGRLARAVERPLRAVARAHRYVVGTGLVLLLLWSYLAPQQWIAPLLLGVGVFLGQTPWAREGAAPPATLWGKAVPVFAAGLLVMWSLSLATSELGEQEARQAGDHLTRRTAVVVLSADRLSLAGPGLRVTDLGAKVHFRYRYTGLRRLIDRNGSYYLLPLGWNPGTGTTYVIQDDDGIRIELMPGTQQR
ncbi:hypothetical protein AB0C96_08615 [Streptomyces sp. NPDC048506]|uniref:hypothetical protein n=1 Tax=Streptomyces sp. NPDC048506 TaxID=3155028 RepID=UPI00342A6F15